MTTLTPNQAPTQQPPTQPHVGQMEEATAYFGSRISLISKSEIRYEGILHSVDTNQGTVTLQSVRSLGTEGRTNIPIASSDYEYPYIVFRAPDIKELQVSEPPFQSQSNMPNNDPAIVAMPPEVSSIPGLGMYQFPGQYQQPQFYMPPYGLMRPSQSMQPPFEFGGRVPNQQSAPAPLSKAPAQALSVPTPAAPNPNSIPRAPVAQSNTQPKQAVEQTSKLPPTPVVSQPKQEQQQRFTQSAQQQAWTSGSRGPAYGTSVISSPSSSQPQTSAQPQPRFGTLITSSGSTLHIRRIPQGASSANVPQQSQTRTQQAPAPQSPTHKSTVQVQVTVQKLGEFDFESANAKLDKQKLIDEFEHAKESSRSTASQPPVTSGYDKAISFFDNISCEATEPKEKETRQALAEQRRVDAETFGAERRGYHADDYRAWAPPRQQQGRNQGYAPRYNQYSQQGQQRYYYDNRNRGYQQQGSGYNQGRQYQQSRPSAPLRMQRHLRQPNTAAPAEVQLQSQTTSATAPALASSQ